MVDERADLVGFGLNTRLKGVGRVSTVVREGLRRALLEVLFRQTEFNRAISELIHSQDSELQALGATVRAQLEIQVSADERLEALERKLDRGVRDLDYASFAERFHGTPERRRERLSRYVARLQGCSEVIDAGCGRGEFLELLRDAGIAAVGVDSDLAMVARCRQLGLETIHRDVLLYLREQPEESHGGVFGAHLIEHLERGEIVELVRLAFSRLRPKGILVLETVNPECLLTYTDFYADFGHVAPVPPLALQWLAESCGFVSVEVEYSSPVPHEQRLVPMPAFAGEEPELAAFNRGLAAANDLLFGFQEYVLTARKPG